MKAQLEQDRKKTEQLRKELADMEQLAKAHLGVTEIKYDESRFIKFEKPRRAHHTTQMAELEQQANQIQLDMNKMGIKLEQTEAKQQSNTESTVQAITEQSQKDEQPLQPQNYSQSNKIDLQIPVVPNQDKSVSRDSKQPSRQASASTFSTKSDKPTSKPPSRPSSSKVSGRVSQALVMGPPETQMPQNKNGVNLRVSSASAPQNNLANKPKPLNTSQISDGGTTPRVISARDAVRGSIGNSSFRQNPPKKPSSILPSISGLEITGVRPGVSVKQGVKK